MNEPVYTDLLCPEAERMRRELDEMYAKMCSRAAASLLKVTATDTCPGRPNGCAGDTPLSPGAVLCADCNVAEIEAGRDAEEGPGPEARKEQELHG